MTSIDTARHLLDSAVADEQVARRIVTGDDVDSIRQEVRRLARERSIRVRTAVTDGVLVVVLVRAALWHESTATMRLKLTPPDES